jgi:hypothetical protein
MTHPDDDQLLKLSLELLNSEEEKEIRLHLLDCRDCSARWNELQASLQYLRELRPQGKFPRLPQTTPYRKFVIWKVAAVLLIAILGAWETAVMISQPVHVVPSCLDVKPPTDSLARFTVADGTLTAQG